jgi:hypothetical protein
MSEAKKGPKEPTSTLSSLKGLDATTPARRMLRAALVSVELHNTKPDAVVRERNNYLFGPVAQAQFTSNPATVTSHPPPPRTTASGAHPQSNATAPANDQPGRVAGSKRRRGKTPRFRVKNRRKRRRNNQ